MDKIKVLHFPIRNTNGGITRNAIKYWKFINKDRFHFDFATCSRKIDFEDEIISTGSQIHYISCYGEEDPEQFCDEFRNILSQGYDAVHLNTSWWKSFLVEKVAKELGIKVIVVHARNTFVDINDEAKRNKELANHERLKKLFDADMATHLLACSWEAADFLFGPQIPREKIRIFHNAVDLARFSYDTAQRREWRRKLGVENNYVIGNVGRFVFQKNPMFLVECFYEVQKEKQNAKLLLIGDGELEGELKDRVEELQISDKVIFTGQVKDVENYMQAMDLFAFPTRFEGLANVLIEAQAMGLMCLTSDNVSRESSVTDNVEYLPLQQDLWIEKIKSYFNGYVRRNMENEIRNAGYNITEEIKVLENIYQGIV